MPFAHPSDTDPGRNIFVNPDAAKGNDSHNGRDWSRPKLTVGGAAEIAESGDDIVLKPGSYDETVTIDTEGITVWGPESRGSAAIEPQTAGAEGMTVEVDDVTLHNVGVAGESTATYSLQVGTQTESPDRFRAYNCKFEGAPVILKGAGDVLFEDCEFAWEGALQFAANDNGFCTQVTLRRCRFHNITAEQVKSLAAGGVRNLILDDCVFDNAEDGTAPTKYLDIAEAGDTGIVRRCSFATATNASSKLGIAAGVKWVANETEAGISSARPS